jgi:hypothetical protein
MIKRKRRSGFETRRQQQGQPSEKKLAAREGALAVQPSGEPKCSFCGLTGDMIKNEDATAFICSKCLSASFDAVKGSTSLPLALGVLVHRMNQHGFDERAVPQLVDAKPPFNWPELIDLSKCVKDLAEYWKAWQQREKLKSASEEQKPAKGETIKLEAKTGKVSS